MRYLTNTHFKDQSQILSCSVRYVLVHILPQCVWHSRIRICWTSEMVHYLVLSYSNELIWRNGQVKVKEKLVSYNIYHHLYPGLITRPVGTLGHQRLATKIKTPCISARPMWPWTSFSSHCKLINASSDFWLKIDKNSIDGSYAKKKELKKKEDKPLLPEKINKPLQFLPVRRMANASDDSRMFFFSRSPGNILWMGSNSFWLRQEYLWQYLLHVGFLLLYGFMDMSYLTWTK